MDVSGCGYSKWMCMIKIRIHGKPSVRGETAREGDICKIRVNKVFHFYLPQHSRRCNCMERNTKKYLFTNCVNKLCKELPHDMQRDNSSKSVFI